MNKIYTIIAFLLCALSVSAQESKDSIYKKVDINEVVVVGDSIFHYGDRDEYRVTKNMRRGSFNTAEMIDKVPGFSYNIIDNSLTFEGSKKIVFLVDSVEKSFSYVSNLHHARFDKVQVIRNPRGKYAEYDFIVNLKTKQNYVGYDNTTGLDVSYFLTDGNGKDKHIPGIDPYNSFTYTWNKWNFYLGYSFNFSQGEGDEFETRSYLYNNLKEETVANADGSKNATGFYRHHTVNAAIDHQFDKRNSVSISYFIKHSNTDTYYNKTVTASDLEGNPLNTYISTSNDDYKGNRQGLGLYYRGGRGAWNYNATLNYVNRVWDTKNHLARTTGYRNSDERHQRMNHVFGSADINRRLLNDKLYVSVSYNFFWKQYDQFSAVDNQRLSKNNLSYHYAGLYASYNLSRDFSVWAAAQARRYASTSATTDDHYMSYSGNLGLFRRFGKKAWTRFNYYCHISNPTLNQTTSYGTFTDSLMWSGGNPALRAKIRHQVELRVNLLESLTIKGGVCYEPRSIVNVRETTEGYLQNGQWASYVAKMPENGKYLNPYFSLNFNKKIKSFSIDASLWYDYMWSKYKDYEHSIDGLHANLQVAYYWTRRHLNIYAGCYDNGSCWAGPQSWSRGKMSGPFIGLRKTWLKNRLMARLTYFPPFSFGDIEDWSRTSVPGYESYTLTPQKDRVCNKLQFTIVYRLFGGKSVRNYKREMSSEE